MEHDKNTRDLSSQQKNVGKLNSSYNKRNSDMQQRTNYSRARPYHQENRTSSYNSSGSQYSRPQKDYSHIRYPGDVEVSKEIVRIVRHGKYRWITMDQEGYVRVDDFLKDAKFKSICGNIRFEDIQHIVDKNDKKRFEMKCVDSVHYIKAVQGHTVQVSNLSLKPLDDPNKFSHIFHGTYSEAWEKIKLSGLSRMQRNHIHFAIGMPDDPDVVSGMRRSCEIAIEINMDKALNAGIKFFISSNEVVLSEGDHKGRIHPKFFSRVFWVSPMRNIAFDVPPEFNDEEEKKSPTHKVLNSDTSKKIGHAKAKVNGNLGKATDVTESKPLAEVPSLNDKTNNDEIVCKEDETKRQSYFDEKSHDKEAVSTGKSVQQSEQDETNLDYFESPAASTETSEGKDMKSEKSKQNQHKNINQTNSSVLPNPPISESVMPTHESKCEVDLTKSHTNFDEKPHNEESSIVATTVSTDKSLQHSEQEKPNVNIESLAAPTEPSAEKTKKGKAARNKRKKPNQRKKENNAALQNASNAEPVFTLPDFVQSHIEEAKKSEVMKEQTKSKKRAGKRK